MNGEISFLTEALKKAAIAFADGMHGEIQVGKVKVTFETHNRGGRLKFDFTVVPFTPVIEVPVEHKPE